MIYTKHFLVNMISYTNSILIDVVTQVCTNIRGVASIKYVASRCGWHEGVRSLSEKCFVYT